MKGPGGRVGTGRVLNTVRDANEQKLAAAGDPEILTRIEQSEMAWQVQSSIDALQGTRPDSRIASA